MAEPTNLARIEQSPADEYRLTVVDIDSTGQKTSLAIPLAESSDWLKWPLLLRAAVLKRNTWKSYSIPEIVHAILYADRLGLDIVQGDVYMAEEGRLAVTNDARIKHALSSGRIEGYECTVEEIDYEPVGRENWRDWSTMKTTGRYEGPNYRATVTVRVKGWIAPVVYETTLDEFFLGRNPNWRTRPKYMLRKSAIAHALNEVCPVGIDIDEVPPIEQPALPIAAAVAAATAPPADLTSALEASLEKAQSNRKGA